MKRYILLSLFLALIIWACQQETNLSPLANSPQSNEQAFGRQATETTRNMIYVAAPTGIVETDRASIEAAVNQAQPGDIIQFDKGTYVIGLENEGLIIDVPGITLQGHSEGTTLKGGDDLSYTGQYEGIFLIGGKQTVRHFTFESFSTCAISLNMDFFSEKGGYVIENNIIQNCAMAVTYYGLSDDVTRITHNTINNNDQAWYIFGKTCHIEWNKIMATDPQQAPMVGYAGNVGGFIAYLTSSENNVFAHNSISNIADGFQLVSAGDSTIFLRNNKIFANKFVNQTIHTYMDLGCMAFILNFGGTLENNLVRNNHYYGSGGGGLMVWGAANTLIAHNSVSDVRFFPDNLWPTGYGIFLDANSDKNKLLDNRFSNVELYDIALFGNNNTVIMGRQAVSVLDEGQGNTIIGPMRTRHMARTDFSKSIGQIVQQKKQQTMDTIHLLTERLEKIRLAAEH
jgi:hypothetical protein